MTTKTFQTFSFNTAEQFKESFFESSPTITYVFIGNHTPWPNESVPPDILGSSQQEKSSWDNMYAAKKITGNDLELVVPWSGWATGNVYKQYDDSLEMQELLSANVSASIDPMYIITDDRNVYKCLSNNSGTASTTKPTGDYTSSNGTISTSDGYIWKYMFNVLPSNRFLANTEWIPAPTNTGSLGYNVNNFGIIDGQLTTIVIENSGSNYITVSSNCNPFVAGQTTLVFANTKNITSNMYVTGTGIAGGTYISSVNPAQSSINLSLSTTESGGGPQANTLIISPRIYIDGDGVGAITQSTINAAGSITSVNLSSFGTGYSRANVIAYANGTNFSARVIVPPKFGHAYNPAKELNANNVMVRVRVGELDSTENGLIESNTNFRQIGLIRNPYKYGETISANNNTSNTVISQTTDLTVVSGSVYYKDEFVYQGNVNNPIFSGYLQSENGNILKVTKVKGTPSIGTAIVGGTSASSRSLVSVKNPEFEPYSGAIIYMENNEKVERSDGQSEILKFVVRF